MSGLISVNQDRLWRDHMTLAEIGKTPGGGVGRLALTDLDKQARDLFVDWAKAAGCQVRVDRMGNIIARRFGTDPTALPVMTGSHLDTQPLGGRFDGIYGVLAGLEVVRSLNDAGIETRAPLDVVVWTDEEGVRFAGGCVASGVFAGKYDVEAGLNVPDRDGVTTIGQELERIGYAGEMDCGYPLAAYFEAHIEQGPVLEREGIILGAVGGAQGQRCFNVTVAGVEGHAGTLPMVQRKDAMVGAARMMAGLNEVAYGPNPHAVITTGHVQVRPNSRNTIPGQVIFSIDSRHPDDDILKDIKSEMQSLCKEIADEAGLDLSFEEVSYSKPITFSQDCVEAVKRAAKRRDISCRDIYSGAGHDACNLASAAPTGMIFVPCKDGISHNEQEDARPQDLAAGCAVLLDVMTEWAGHP